MKVPKDQGLVLAIFYSISLVAILMVWLLLPPTISQEGDEEKTKVKVVKPEEAIQNVEEILTQAESALAELEKAKTEKAKPEKAKTGSAKKSPQALPEAAAGSGTGGKASASQGTPNNTPDKKASKSGDKK